MGYFAFFNLPLRKHLQLEYLVTGFHWWLHHSFAIDVCHTYFLSPITVLSTLPPGTLQKQLDFLPSVLCYTVLMVPYLPHPCFRAFAQAVPSVWNTLISKLTERYYFYRLQPIPQILVQMPSSIGLFAYAHSLFHTYMYYNTNSLLWILVCLLTFWVLTSLEGKKLELCIHGSSSSTQYTVGTKYIVVTEW